MAGRSIDQAKFSGGGGSRAFEGGRLKDKSIAARYMAGIWQKGVVVGSYLEISGQQVIGPQEAAIGDVSGGVNIDTEARTALNTLLSACRSHGLIAS